MPVHQISNEFEFNDAIAKHPRVVCDFTAVWCGPCRMISPKFDEYSAQFPMIHCIKVDVDLVPTVAKSEAISAMPTFKFYKDGKATEQVVGANATALRAKMEAFAGTATL